MLRQPQRRAPFKTAFQSMPLWETWTTDDIDGKKRNHCKSVTRRKRRAMARSLVKRMRGASK